MTDEPVRPVQTEQSSVEAFLANCRQRIFAGDVPKLTSAVEAVSALHVPTEETAYTACTAHSYQNGLPRTVYAFDVMRDCLDCTKATHLVCKHCCCPNDSWPCPTYQALLRALT